MARDRLPPETFHLPVEKIRAGYYSDAYSGTNWATSNPRGVDERLVRKVRAALDADGFEAVKIVASGGFTAEKIRAFERTGVPADLYGVGSSLLRGSNDFTADVVRVEGKPVAKVGCAQRANPRLEH